MSANSFSINCQLTFVVFLLFLFILFNSAGVGRTGVFITLSIVLERMRYEGVVDIFQTVKMLRTQRPAMVQTEVSKTVPICNGDRKEVVFTQEKKCSDKRLYKKCLLLYLKSYIGPLTTGKICHKGIARTISYYCSGYCKMRKKRFISIVDPKLW